MPEPVRRNRLEVALWVFSLSLPLAFALRGIADVLLSNRFQTKYTVLCLFQTMTYHLEFDSIMGVGNELYRQQTADQLTCPRTFHIFGTCTTWKAAAASLPAP